jgi:hypothetical protein
MPAKLYIAYVVIPLVFMLGYTVWHARKYRTVGDTLALEHHRGGTTCVMWLVLLTTVLIELMMLAQPAVGTRSALFWVHLPLAIIFVALFGLLRFKITGLASKVHRPLAYACLAAFAGALITGGILLWRM